MDIDTDFAYDIRDNVVKYVAEKYAYKGKYPKEIKGTTCNIFTEGTNAARASVRAVGRATDKPLEICDKIAKAIPNGCTLKQALDTDETFKELYLSNAETKQIIDDAMLIEGLPDHTGVHAAGVIIADKPISEYAAMFFDEKTKSWAVQYDMVSCEEDLGFLKMDVRIVRRRKPSETKTSLRSEFDEILNVQLVQKRLEPARWKR